MKKCAAVAAAAALLICLVSPVFAGGNEDDLKVIKRAVKGRAEGAPEKGAKWFKVVITDRKSGTVQVTLPVSIAKIIGHCKKDRHLHTCKMDIDVAAALRELEELGPLTLLEIVEADAKIKIWLE